ncbi:MAG: NUDIX hydrolase [Pyrinomonadaceae bacterium]|nr:NUDIX hydrolase [Acidobacteriota bacterium]MBK7934036.1 NUDIX hydrolase [Acidobacteriota bacterium]MBP7375813.1 NUDIX hydrolase [Pyrinomonadaceae bacterium]
MKPQTLSSETIFKGRIFDLRVDTIREGDVEYKREIVVHQGSAVIVPVFEDGTVALVRQYRHATGGYQLELPAGCIEPGETFEQAATRELEEETGFRAGKIEKLAEFYVSPGFLTEKMYVFLATELTESVQTLDDDEIVEMVRFTLVDAIQMVHDGRIEDAKTIAGILLTAARSS